MVCQQIVGIPMGTNCAPIIADLFLYCYERDFRSNLQNSLQFDIIDVPGLVLKSPPNLRLNIAYFAVAEGWLLLDIG